MPKLTDDELGDLLRETFADREASADRETFADREYLIDQLPGAKRRRGRLPVLLAAAAVLAVLAGALYGVGRVGAADPAPPAATPTPTRTASDDALIWTASIETLLRSVKPGSGAWRSVIVVEQSDDGTNHPPKGPPISADQQEMMTYLVRRIAPLQFREHLLPAPPTCQDNRVGVVLISDVVDKADHVEVRVSLFHDCNHASNATYRVEHRGPSWVVTGTVSTSSASW
ncbi:hypothetical protein [Kribbella sp. NPDC003557]|uniref:hypothetical protein n=1 Tax=Kribbella sp. NPDC003557 TaxID=3154449 RepID=UPI0033BE7013